MKKNQLKTLIRHIIEEVASPDAPQTFKQLDDLLAKLHKLKAGTPEHAQLSDEYMKLWWVARKQIGVNNPKPALSENSGNNDLHSKLLSQVKSIVEYVKMIGKPPQDTKSISTALGLLASELGDAKITTENYIREIDPKYAEKFLGGLNESQSPSPGEEFQKKISNMLRNNKWDEALKSIYDEVKSGRMDVDRFLTLMKYTVISQKMSWAQITGRRVPPAPTPGHMSGPLG